MQLWTEPTLGSFLRHLDGTRHAWIWDPYQPYQSSIEASWNGMASLETALEQAKTLRGLEDTLHQIQALRTDLVPQIRAPQTLRRIPVAHASKGILNPHRVLRGSTKPYQTRAARLIPQHGKLVHIVLPGSFHAGVSNDEILLASVASVTLADLLQAAGYIVTVSIAAISLGLLPAQAKRGDMQDTCTVVGLRANNAAWSLHTLAVATQPTFLRRLMFRYWESMAPQYGTLASGYGQTINEQDRFLSRVQGVLGTDPVLIGAGQWDHITTPALAAAWIQAQLAHVTA